MTGKNGLAVKDEKGALEALRGDVLPVLKRVLAENARDYVGLYVAAIGCLH